jgi:hypothetical protein
MRRPVSRDCVHHQFSSIVWALKPGSLPFPPALDPKRSPNLPQNLGENVRETFAARYAL